MPDNASSSSLTDSYAAGLIDGEGYIGIQCAGGSYQVRLKVMMTDKGLPALKRMERHYGGTVRFSKAQTRTDREAYTWRLTGRAATAVIEKVLPQLRVKRDAAVIALQFQMMVDASPRRSNKTAVWTDEMRTRAGEFRRRIQEANRRGPDPEEATLPNRVPLAYYAAGSWWEPNDSLLGPVAFTGPLPASGSMRSGRLYNAPDPFVIEHL